MAMAGKMPEDTPMLLEPLSKKTAEGKPAYTRSIEKLNDTAEPLALIRNALTAQFDQNAIVVLTGPATNLAKLLDLPGARAVIAQKVRYLTVALGAFPNGQPETGITCDIASAKKLFAEWPTPIVVSGKEVGDALPFPGASIEKDYAWSPTHPVVDAYRAYKPMPYDAPSWAMSAVLYAVRPQENFFKLSEPGTVSVQDDGRTKFTPSADGKHKYLIVDPAQKEKVIQTYTEIASLKPAGRPQRFRPPQQQKKQL
jgi:inosine-uridine nucleoside N-ribohydrolase